MAIDALGEARVGEEVELGEAVLGDNRLVGGGDPLRSGPCADVRGPGRRRTVRTHNSMVGANAVETDACHPYTDDLVPEAVVPQSSSG